MKKLLRNCAAGVFLFCISNLNAQSVPDEQFYTQMAIEQGIDSVDIPGFVHFKMYGYQHDSTPAFRYQPSAGAPLSIANPGFETGDFTSWTGVIGDNTVSSVGPLQNIQPGIFTGSLNPSVMDMNARHSIMSDSAGNDPEGNFAIVPAGYGNYVARLGNAYANYQGQYIEQSWTVTPADTLFQFSFAVVMYDGGHPAIESPYFSYEIMDSSGAVLFSRMDLSTTLTADYQTGVSGNGFHFLPWETDTFNLQNYIGQTVTLRFTTAGCIWGGHYGYCYVDVDPTDQASVGMNEVSGPAMQVYPNPSADGVYHVIGNSAVHEEVPTVYDMSGRAVEAVITATGDGWTIDISALAPGVYSIQLPASEGVTHCNVVR